MKSDVQHIEYPTSSAPNRDLAKMLVPPAMLILAIALGIAGHLHLGLSSEIATAIGVALFSLMLMCHVLLRVADEAERAADEAAEREAAQVTSPMPAAVAERWTTPDSGLLATAEKGEVAQIIEPADFVKSKELRAHPAAWTMSPTDLQRQSRSESNAVADESRAGPVSDLGELRPPSILHTLSEPPQTATASPTKVREVDRIEAILLRLARQIHDGSDAVRKASQPTEEPPPETLASAEPSMQPGSAAPDAALTTAVDALRSTAEAMRGPTEPALPPVSAAELRIAAVAEAIAQEQADVFLSPILGLGDDSARHFEVSVQLRVDDGEARAIAAVAGLLPLLDALNVRHSAGFALMLERRSREGAVFSSIGGASLESEQFVTDVSGRHAQGVANRMVLSFAQAEMRGLGPVKIAALGDLSRLGFRFSLQEVADLDMDFEALHDLGFEFVKLDAAVFAAGLLCSGEHVPATDICRHFEELGLAVIASGICDTPTRELMMSCGVEYGQGALFGAARPVPVTSSASPMAA